MDVRENKAKLNTIRPPKTSKEALLALKHAELRYEKSLHYLQGRDASFNEGQESIISKK